jgi:hypothetical protein
LWVQLAEEMGTPARLTHGGVACRPVDTPARHC